MTAKATPGPELRQASEFAVLFSEAVTEAQRRLGKLKKQLASDCGMRADRFSHLQAGSRRPTHREVLRIGQGLRLDEAAIDRLLEAAGFSPLSAPAGAAPDATRLADRLGDSERALALAEMEGDLGLVRRAWEHYVDSQVRNRAREWADASRRHQEGIELYWQLRAMAARFLSQVDLAAAAADSHLNRMAEAKARCEEGLEAAMVASSRAFEVVLLAQLASIERLSSDYLDMDDLVRARGHLAWAVSLAQRPQARFYAGLGERGAPAIAARVLELLGDRHGAALLEGA